MYAGLTPVQWRWSMLAHMLFLEQMGHYLVACGPHEPKPDLPPGCLGIYDGLPVYRMESPQAFPHPAVACLGARTLPPGF